MRVNLGDAWSVFDLSIDRDGPIGNIDVKFFDFCYFLNDLTSDVMYSHRKPSKQFDMVDLDPYGTAAPFIDAAVQCITDGGQLRCDNELLCYHFTDI